MIHLSRKNVLTTLSCNYSSKVAINKMGVATSHYNLICKNNQQTIEDQSTLEVAYGTVGRR